MRTSHVGIDLSRRFGRVSSNIHSIRERGRPAKSFGESHEILTCVSVWYWYKDDQHPCDVEHICKMKTKPEITFTRREMLRTSVAAAALAFTQYPPSLVGGQEAESGGVLIPFLDTQPPGKHQTRWSELTDWHTKSDDLYDVHHYNVPGLKAEDHVLEVSGLVRKPRTFSLA